MKRSMLFFLIWACYNTIYAQNNTTTDSESTNSYEQTILFFENDDFKQTIDYDSLYLYENKVKYFENCDNHKAPKDTVLEYGYALRVLAKLYADIEITESISCELKYLSLQRNYGYDLDTLTTFINLGKYYKDDEDFANAEIYLMKALSLSESLSPSIDQRCVNLYMQLASFYGRIKDPYNALVYSEKAKVMESTLNGSDTKTYANIIMNNALYEYLNGNVAYCLTILKQAYQHPRCNKLNVAINLAGVYSAQDEADSCYKYIAEAWDITQKDIIFHVENLTIENRFNYLRTQETYALITLPIYYFLNHENHNGLCKLAYNCILFYKKIGLEITNEKVKDIEKSITFDTIQEMLKENEVAVELWSDMMENYWYSDYILAFIVSPNEEEPIFVGLPKDSIYMALRNEIETSRTFLPLYETMWKKLIQKIDIKRNGKIFISCDDIYSLIPFESICNYDFEYIGDLYSIIRVSYSGNIKNIYSDFYIKNVALYGGLRYDCLSEEETVDEVTYLSTDDNLSYDTITTDNVRGNLRYLPWTQVEIDSICAVLKSFKEIENIQIFNGKYGTEDSFKAFSGNSPSIIHIATHGRFSQPTVEMSWYDYYIYCMENAGVMLSCYSETSDDGYGFLSAEKIRYLDLSNTNLLVLSACNTGFSGVTPHGIYGLQHAFKQAGVGSIIMTLNNVDDIATQYFMTSFYKALASGLDPHDAYKSAQYAIRTNEYFKKFNYWAYFIMLD